MLESQYLFIGSQPSALDPSKKGITIPAPALAPTLIEGKGVLKDIHRIVQNAVNIFLMGTILLTVCECYFKCERVNAQSSQNLPKK